MSEMHDDSTSPETPKKTGGLGGALWKDRSAKGKVGVVVGALFAVSVVGAALSDTPDEHDATPSPPVTTEATAVPAETTTTTPPTTEAPTTTTIAVVTAEDLRNLYAEGFESVRRDVVAAAEELFIIESVDLFEYDPSTDLMTLDVTPAFDFDSGVRDDAWELMRALAPGWDEIPVNDVWQGPSLRVVISTATYECTGEVMQRLADARLARTQWESECRIR